VKKTFLPPLPDGEEAFATVLDARDSIAADLQGLPIALCWPETPLVRGRDLVGYVMPRIDQSFYFTRDVRRKAQLRELQYAVPKASVFSFPFTESDADAYALVVLVARFLEAMHTRQLVYGDISWFNFTFALDPVRLCVHDFDSTRRVGTATFNRQPPANTIDWEDLEAPGAAVATLDSERYKFALLAYRMLVAKDHNSRLPPTLASGTTGLPRDRDLQHLGHRAAGPGGTRPQLSEWLRALA
jgi:hypothetical protein